MKEHQVQLRVRYSETDQMGVVYHGNYVYYLEIARIEWLRKHGISYKKMEESGVMLPVVSLTINYKKPAGYDDLLTVKAIIKNKPGVKIEFDYEIINEQGEIITTASTILVFVDKTTNRPTRAPQYILDLFEN